MSVIVISDKFTIAPGATMAFVSWFNRANGDLTGGDYKGPGLVMPQPLGFGQGTVFTSAAASLDVLDSDGDCFYRHSVTNPNDHPVEFNHLWLFD